MYRDFFAHNPLLAMPMLAMGLFVTVFVAVVARAMSSRRRDEHALAARLPLEPEGSASR